MYSAEFVERFWKKVDRTNESDCWNWNASLAGKGYGQIKPDKGLGRRNLYAHRVAYELHHGAIPDGLEVCHRCDNPKCCNPAHLFAGTRKQNLQDMAEKMRSTWGVRSGTCKLTEDQVRAIRVMLADNVPQTQIAKWFNISQIQISRIHTRKQWSKLI